MSGRSDKKSPVGRRLRQARNVRGISQKQLGILAGIDRFSASPRINQYERNKHIPDYLTAKNLAITLGISVAYLYADDDQLAEIIQIYDQLGPRKRSQMRRMMLEKYG